MNILFALLLALPHDYLNLLMKGKYEEAITYCDEMISETKGAQSFTWKSEQGDVYFGKIHDVEQAVAIYQELIDNYPPEGGFWIFSKRYKYPDLGWMYLRLAQALEMNEDFLNAAKTYEIVATQFRKPPLDSFALIGVERCFKKNYQDYVATVDGYNITRLELDEKIGSRPRDEKPALDDMILERLIYASAVENDVKETEFFKNNVMVKMREHLLKEVHNISVVEKAIPSEREMKKYYQIHKEEKYKLREEIKGQEIVVESDSIAQFLHDSLTKDIASFDTLARLYSTVTTRSSGGYIRHVYRGAKPESVEEALFNAEPNTLTDIIPFDDKYGIYLVTEHKPERYRDFEDVKSQIETAVRNEKIKQIEEKFLKDLRSHADIIKTSSDTTSGEPEDSFMVMAVVNGREVLWTDLKKRNESRPRFTRGNLAEPEKRAEELDKMIGEELQLEWAENNKYFLHDGYFVAIKNEIAKMMGGALYTKIVIEGVSVDSQKVEEYFNEHKEEFKMPESVHCLEIVVDDKILAQDLRIQLLNNPEMFDSLARAHSTAPTKRLGGDTGLIRRGMRSKKFEDAAFRLEAGELSQVLSMDDAYYIIMVVEHRPEGHQDIEEVWPHIEGRLLRERQRTVAEEFLVNIREEAEIEIFLDSPDSETNTEDKGAQEGKE